MLYIIETHTDEACPNCDGRGYRESAESGARCTECMGDGNVAPVRRAVATLDEARTAAAEHASAAYGDAEITEHLDAGTAALNLPEAGGTIGPLPDGTVIEVRHASWDDLVGPGAWDAHTTEAEVIDAYNEANA